MFSSLEGCRKCYHTHKAMCYVQWNNFWPTKIFGFHFLLKNRKKLFGSGCSEPIFYFLVALLLTPNIITCTVWHAEFAWKLISQDANSIKCIFVIVTSIEEIWPPFQLMKKGGKSLMRIIFLQASTWSIASFFSLLKRNGIYWDFVLKSHRKWSICVIFWNFIIRNCRENNLVLSVVREG